ncbi:unnamed protein product [Amoebophrya sp. A120]|nr:unnamed protein product [Amoebophrya sp. A120]|eukprot:GSA120T00012821001.1
MAEQVRTLHGGFACRLVLRPRGCRSVQLPVPLPAPSAGALEHARRNFGSTSSSASSLFTDRSNDEEDFSREFERLFVGESSHSAGSLSRHYAGSFSSVDDAGIKNPDIASSSSSSTKDCATPACRAVWRCAIRNCRDARVWERLLDEISRQMNFLKPQDVLLLYYGLSRVKYRDRKFLKELSFQAIRHCSEYAPRGLALILNAFRKLELNRDLDTFQLLLQSYLSLHGRWTAWDLALVCNAAAHFHLYEPRLWKLLSAKKMSILAQNTEPQGLALIVAALARIDWRDGGVLAVCAKAAVRQYDRFSAQNIAVLYSAFCKLDFDFPKLYHALELAAVERGYVTLEKSSVVGTASSAVVPSTLKDFMLDEASGETENTSVSTETESFLSTGRVVGRKIQHVSWCDDGETDDVATEDTMSQESLIQSQREKELLALLEDDMENPSTGDEMEVLLPNKSRIFSSPSSCASGDDVGSGYSADVENASAGTRDQNAKADTKFDLLALAMLAQASVCFTKGAERNPEFVRAVLRALIRNKAKLDTYHLRKLRSAYLFLKHQEQFRKKFRAEIFLLERDVLPRHQELLKTHVEKLVKHGRIPCPPGQEEAFLAKSKDRKSPEGETNFDYLDPNTSDTGEKMNTDNTTAESTSKSISELLGLQEEQVKHSYLREEEKFEAKDARLTPEQRLNLRKIYSGTKNKGADGSETAWKTVLSKRQTSRWKREVFDIVEKELRIECEKQSLVYPDHEDAVVLPERKTVIHCVGVYGYYSDTTERTALSKLHSYLLEIQGYSVMHIPYYEWSELKTTEDKVLYLVSKGRQIAAKRSGTSQQM